MYVNVLNFESGYTFEEKKTRIFTYVRCVRGGR